MSSIIRRWASTATKFRPERPNEILQLLKPIGLASKPLPNARDDGSKTLQERKAEFMDVKRNRLRREELKKDLAKSSFEDIYKFRHTGGKIFTAPPRPFSEKSSLFMANIFGSRIDDPLKPESSLLHLLSSTRPNLVKVFSSSLGKKQIDEFTEGLDLEKMGVQLIDVNVPTNWINRLLVKFFANRIRKSEIANPAVHKYLLANSKLTKDTKQALAASNELAGYLYVVDSAGKLRWATSGPSINNEKSQMLSLIEELKTSSSS